MKSWKVSDDSKYQFGIGTSSFGVAVTMYVEAGCELGRGGCKESTNRSYEPEDTDSEFHGRAILRSEGVESHDCFPSCRTNSGVVGEASQSF
jgi:hypothetical protein